MEIAVLAQGEASRLVEAAARGLPVAEARLMRAIVRRLHGRHIGITPELATALARLLTAPPVRSVLARGSVTMGAEEAAAEQQRLVGAMPWSAALERMSLLHDPGGNSRLMPHFAPWWVVTRLAAPLIWRACEVLGQTAVFGADALNDGDGSGYTDYAARLKREVTALIEAEDEDGMPELFWRDLAHSLAGMMKRQTNSRGSADGGLPQVDPANLALMLRLPLRETRKRMSRKVVARRASDAAHRAGIHPQMMGVTGIRVASGVDEVDRMLSSEWLNPPAILADRLMNTGFLATDRPPPQQHRRDVMVIGLSMLPATGGISALARTAYVEAMRRLVPLLVQAEQRDSRCVWMELGQLGGINAQGFSFDKVVALAARAGGMRGGVDAPPRDRFIAGMELLPDFLDDHEAYPPRLLPPEALSADLAGGATTGKGQGESKVNSGEATSLTDLRGAERWAEMALERLDRLPGFTATEANPSSYSTLHLLAFVPQAEGVEEVALTALQRRLESQIKGAGMAGRAASLVVVPQSGELTPMRRIRSLLMPSATTSLSTATRSTPEGKAAAWANEVAEFGFDRIEEAMFSG
ncbi:MAG: hypothetical protein Alpg2KO_07070 [Alphaproteobacteria bacterium]